MSVKNQIRFIVYRVHAKGMEILVNQAEQRSELFASARSFPSLEEYMTHLPDGIIQLETTENEQIIALEADWHEIPRIRSILKYDMHLMKDTLSHMLPELEQATYVKVKELFKKALPHEYAALKELKETIRERNLLSNI
ncbi:MAG TPA: hypothetical protein PK006_12625 [Saprospiraceae bacterium]|nr:hypothetical protein [Saprospiraceae bacterium]